MATTMSQNDVLEAIAKMTVMDIVELVEKMEEKLLIGGESYQ